MSAQPHFRPRAQRRDRDAELERLVAAELDACEAPLDTFIEPPALVPESEPALSAAERDFVELVRQWLDRRPNKHQLMHLICEGEVLPMPEPPAQIETSAPIVESQPVLPADPDSHAAP